jgi:hypothetical protein
MMFKPTHMAVANLKGFISIGQDWQHVYDDWYINEDGVMLCIAKHNLCKIEDVEKADMLLPTDAQERKQIPIVSGVLDYFPLAIAEVAKCSWAGNQQHHPDKELHWDKTKSTDHADCIGRHLIDRGKFDTDGQRHSAKLAWRALALLQLELEEETKKGN